MNYINNPTIGCCCGFYDSDKIEISESSVMIDCETGQEPGTFTGFTPGHTYRCEKRYVVTQHYTTLGEFETLEQALELYRKIVDGIRERNTVIDI